VATGLMEIVAKLDAVEPGITVQGADRARGGVHLIVGADDVCLVECVGYKERRAEPAAVDVSPVGAKLTRV
jgi:hypothetical protein